VATTTELKTGCLMELAAVLGAEAAGAGAGAMEALASFGRQLGVGLQMLDDVGGLLCDRRANKACEDLLLGRPTWPWAWLAEDLGELPFAALQQRARQLRDRADARKLAAAMREALAGQGRLRVRSHLAHGMSELRERIGDSPAIAVLEAEISRLEESYG
jgi:geranylgeranyl pyrophosphate synthase